MNPSTSAKLGARPPRSSRYRSGGGSGKSHPWRTDVQQRSSRRSSSATSSRSAWKLRMQERKAVFDSPVITVQEEDEEEERGHRHRRSATPTTLFYDPNGEADLGKIPWAPKKEVTSKSRAQPPPKTVTPPPTHKRSRTPSSLDSVTEELEEDQFNDSLSLGEDEDSEYSVASDSATIISNASNAHLLPLPAFEGKARPTLGQRSNSISDLRTSIHEELVKQLPQFVHRGSFRVVEAMGHGNGTARPRKSIAEHPARPHMDKVISELKAACDYCNGMPDDVEQVEEVAPLKLDLKNDPAMQAFDKLLAARAGEVDDDCWTEYTAESSVPQQRSVAEEEEVDYPDDYSEYTVETVATRQEAKPAMISSLQQSRMFSNSFVPDELPTTRVPDDDEYTEYTMDDQTIIEEVTVAPDEETVYDEQTVVDEETVVSEMGNTFATTPIVTGDDDEEYEEITVAGPPIVTPRSADEDDYTEYTLEEETVVDEQQERAAMRQEFSQSRMFSNPNSEAFEIKTTSEGSVPDDDDITYYDEFTVADSIPPTSNQPVITITKKTFSSPEEETETTVTTAVSDDSSTFEHHHDSSSSLNAPTASADVPPASASRAAEYLRQDIWSHDSHVVWMALTGLKEEAINHSASIVRFGGLLAVVRAMEVHKALASIQILGCQVLGRLAHADRETRRAVAQVGGIQAIVNALDEHLEDPEFQIVGCRILSEIVGDFEDTSRHLLQIPKMTVEIVLESLELHENHAGVQAAAFGALVHLCLDCPPQLKQLSELNGFSCMTMALQRSWTSEFETEKHEAISRFSMLLRQLAMGGR